MSAKHLPHELNPCACGGKPYPLIESTSSSHKRKNFRGCVKCKSCDTISPVKKNPRLMAEAWNQMNPRTDADDVS